MNWIIGQWQRQGYFPSFFWEDVGRKEVLCGKKTKRNGKEQIGVQEQSGAVIKR